MRGLLRHLLLIWAVALVLVIPPVHGMVPEKQIPASHPGPLFDASGPVSGDKVLGPLSPDRPLVFVLGLHYRNQGALGALLAGVQDPASPVYHHYVTAAEFDAQYGPSPHDITLARAYMLSHGALSATTSRDGLLLTLVLTSSTAERMFGTPFDWFQGPEGVYYGPTGSPTLPSPLSGIVTSVAGISDRDNLRMAHTAREIAPSRSLATGSGLNEYDLVQGSSTQLFWGTDYRAVYDELPLIQAGVNGTGYAVATLLTSGWNQTANNGSGEDLPPYDPSAIGLYYKATFPEGTTRSLPTGVPVTLGNTTPPPPGQPPQAGSHRLLDDTGSVDENSLDLEMASSMAPGASVYEFYFAESLIAQSLSPAAGDFDSALSSALSYHYGGQTLAAISNSWGLFDVNDSRWDSLMEKAAAMGVTILASSGDQGDAPITVQNHPQGQWPSFPATAANETSGVVAVGGTTLTVSGTPTGTWNPNSNTIPPPGYDAPNISGIATEQAWFTPSSDPNSYGGSEGGISIFVNEPSWQAESAAQSGIKNAASKENTQYARGVPDISAAAYGTIIFDSQEMVQGTQYVGLAIVAGTSVASPLMAGLVAVVAEEDGHALGFLDPALYGIAGYFLEHPGSADPIRDVTTGRNYLFNASTGWDALTGWGSPDALLLASALKNSTYTAYIYNLNAVPGKASGVLPPIPKTPSRNVDFEELVLIVAAVSAFVAIIAVYVARSSANRRAANRFMVQPMVPGPPLVGAAPAVITCGYCHRYVQPGLGFCPYCGSWINR